MIESIFNIYLLTVGIGFVAKLIKRDGIDKRLKEEGYVRNTYIGEYSRKDMLDLLLASLIPIHNLKELKELVTVGMDEIYVNFRNNGILTGNIIEKSKRKPRDFEKSFEEIFKEMFPAESKNSHPSLPKTNYQPQNRGESIDNGKGQYKK